MVTPEEEKEMRKKLEAHENSIETPYKLTLEFQSEEVLKHFMMAMCEGVEQDYWNWVDENDKWKDPVLKGCSQHPSIKYDFKNYKIKFIHHNNQVTKDLGFYLPPGEEL